MMYSTKQSSWDKHLHSALQKQKQEGLYRELNEVCSPVSAFITIKDKNYLHFSSNDYLGLANDLRMKKAVSEVLKTWGTSSSASPLITGHSCLYSSLEKELSAFKHTESALVFSSGYAANVGVISNLVGPKDLLLSDELNHASIVDGVRLSKAKVKIYPHNDLEYVEQSLKNSGRKGKVLVVTDGVFSMDGDLALLPELYALCCQYDALLFVDDAHGTGVLGETGAGTSEYFNLQDADIIQLGTFSKAFGSLGGFVTGKRLLIDYLVNKCRTFIYSTALPPTVLAANQKALQIVQTDPALRKKLFQLGQYFREKLKEMGLSIKGSVNHIFSLIIGKNEDTIQAYNFLLKRGIYVPPIRPPTVPENMSRLRISLSAAHEKEHIDYLLQVLKEHFVS